MDIYRRGACDRCRRQKLRCVRASKPEDSLGGNKTTLDPCQRCVRAGIDCITTLPQPRRLPRTERLSGLNSSSGTDRVTLQPLYPKQTTPYPTGPSDLAFGRSLHDAPVSDGAVNQSPLIFDSASGVHPELPNAYQREEERPSKRRSREIAQHQSPRPMSQGNPMPAIERSPTSQSKKSFQPNQFDLGIQSCQQNDTDYSRNEPASLVSTLFPTDNGFNCSPMQGNTMIDTAVVGRTRDCSLHRLTDLSSKLSRELSNIGSLKLTEILSFSSIQSARYAEQHAVEPPKNIIGRVLDSSQAFLDILEGLPTHSNRDSPAGSECSYFEYLDDTDFATTSGSEVVVRSSTAATGPGISSSSSSNHSPETQSIAGTIDMPTILTILTCYTWLLQAYNTIFSQIYSSLLIHADMPSHPLPLVLPGLHLGGFALDDHGDLQIEILIHLTTAMLDRMEQKLGLHEDDAHSNTDMSSYLNQDAILNKGGIVGTATASALLEVLSRHHGGTQSGTNEGSRARTVKQIMKNIRVVLRDCQILRSTGR